MEPARNIRHRELDIRRGYGHRVFYAACVFEKRGCYCAYALAADTGFRSEHRLYSDRVHFLVLTAVCTRRDRHAVIARVDSCHCGCGALVKLHYADVRAFGKL